MILTCPDCATRYLTKPEAIGPNGRTVRCASCDASWFVTAESAEERDLVAAPVVAEPPRETGFARETIADVESDLDADDATSFLPPSAAGVMREKTERKRAARRIMGVSFMWLFTLAVLAAAALASYMFRGPIVERFPKAATIYKAFGVDVASGGLTLSNVISRSARIDGTPTLIVGGEIHNPSRKTQPVRMVELSLHGPSGDVLTRWHVEIDEAELTPGQSTKFMTQYPNPPVDAVRLQYVFAGDEGEMPVLGESQPQGGAQSTLDDDGPQ
ncbi:MAG: MJ0042-type zinc finger domain-containing protein [Robiginitomaculum sp.]